MEDLFNSTYTTGDLNVEVVDTFAGFLGKFVVIVISIVGFGIVMASILKNSMHGLYAVAPKFWDRVDEVKKAGIRASAQSGNNEVMKLLGSVTSVMLSICPNVKAMTDFDDELLDAKAYFMKAIPLMCVHIFIGVFIWLGYPSKVAQMFSDFGTGMFDVVLNNVDPRAWVESLPDKLAILKFSTDGSKNDFDQHVNKVAKKVASTYIGALPEMTKEKRLSVALEIENWVRDCLSADAMEQCNSDKYKMTVTSTVYKSGNAPDLSYVHGKVNDDGVTTFAYVKGFNDGIDSGVEFGVESWFIRFDLTFTPVASKGKSTNAVVEMSGVSFVYTDTTLITIKAGDTSSGYGIDVQTSASGTATNGNDTGAVVITCDSGTNVIKVKNKGGSKIDLSSVKTITGINGMYYRYGSSKCKITSITHDGGITAKFTTEDGTTWTFGDDPVAASKGSGNNVNSNNTNDGESDNGEDSAF